MHALGRKKWRVGDRARAQAAFLRARSSWTLSLHPRFCYPRPGLDASPVGRTLLVRGATLAPLSPSRSLDAPPEASLAGPPGALVRARHEALPPAHRGPEGRRLAARAAGLPILAALFRASRHLAASAHRAAGVPWPAPARSCLRSQRRPSLPPAQEAHTRTGRTVLECSRAAAAGCAVRRAMQDAHPAAVRRSRARTWSQAPAARARSGPILVTRGPAACLGPPPRRDMRPLGPRPCRPGKRGGDPREGLVPSLCAGTGEPLPHRAEPPPGRQGPQSRGGGGPAPRTSRASSTPDAVGPLCPAGGSMGSRRRLPGLGPLPARSMDRASYDPPQRRGGTAVLEVVTVGSRPSLRPGGSGASTVPGAQPPSRATRPSEQRSQRYTWCGLA